MRVDLIFHLVEPGKWKKWHSGGRYEPPSLEEEGFIHCCTGDQLEFVANRHYQGKQRLILLVIDTTSLKADIEFAEETVNGQTHRYPHVTGPVNIDACIDKIYMNPDKDGNFKIDFASD